MVRRKLAASVIGAGLLVSGVMVAPGCSADPEQPARESISAPRKAGGVIDTSKEKIKTPKPAGKPAGKAGPD